MLGRFSESPCTNTLFPDENEAEALGTTRLRVKVPLLSKLSTRQGVYLKIFPATQHVLDTLTCGRWNVRSPVLLDPEESLEIKEIILR